MPTDTGLTIPHRFAVTVGSFASRLRACSAAGKQVRVKVPYLGGGFGGKLYIKLEALVASLALLVPGR